MANKSLFSSHTGQLVAPADAKNHHHAPAYAFEARHKLAQLVVTGSLNDTFYASAEGQLNDVLDVVQLVDPEFIAKAAVYARTHGHMKDMPALLTAVLSKIGPEHFVSAFNRVIDNGKMIRTFVQIMRSGTVGRKSLGTRPKALIQNWLNNASDQVLLRSLVGQSPSLADVIKMVHPKPRNRAREALFAWILGKPCDVDFLPKAVKDFISFKQNGEGEVPDLPFQMLTSLPLSKAHWETLALRGGWQMVRMNLNTFARHGVFENKDIVTKIAEKIRAPEAIRKARVFPYQLMVAYSMVDEKVPHEIREALQDAMELAIENVAKIEGQIVVCPDVSGSMGSPVTGYRKGSSSKVLCVDVAALVAAAVQRKNPLAQIIPFESDVVKLSLNSRDSVMTNAQKLRDCWGGGTNCSAPLQLLNKQKADVDLVIMISDYESWIDARRHGGTETMRQWEKLKARNPKAKLACLDLTPYGTTQAKERDDILNIGGFSDSVFDVIASFAKGDLTPDHWVGLIEEVRL